MFEKHGMRLFYAFFILLFAAMAALSLIDADLPPTDSTVTLDRADATDAIVDLTLPRGELNVHADAISLVRADFEYEDPDAAPDVTCSVEGGTGALVVQQPATGITTPQDNHFDLTLTNNLPLSMAIMRAVGGSMLDLRDLALTGLTVALGDGDNTVRLGPAYPLLREIDIEGNNGRDVLDMVCVCDVITFLRADVGNGDDTLYLDGDYPALTSLDLDLDNGDDVLLVSGQYDAISTLTVALGPGDDRLVMDGFYPALQQFFIQVGTGDDAIDLSHEWDHSLEIDVVSQSNSTVLYLPQTVGVAVTVRDPGVEISTTNMEQEDDVWVNAAYADAEIVLRIFVSTANVGQVELISGPPREPLIERDVLRMGAGE
jgi:hypothetical protein